MVSSGVQIYVHEEEVMTQRDRKRVDKLFRKAGEKFNKVLETANRCPHGNEYPCKDCQIETLLHEKEKLISRISSLNKAIVNLVENYASLGLIDLAKRVIDARCDCEDDRHADNCLVWRAHAALMDMCIDYSAQPRELP